MEEGAGWLGGLHPAQRTRPTFLFTAPCRLHKVLQMVIKDVQPVPSPQALGNRETPEHQL